LFRTLPLIALLAALLVALLLVGGVQQETAGGDFLDDGYLWVTRSTLLDSAAIERMVARAGAARVRGLLVQVVGRGDAYYRSDLLPRAEALRGIGFDPLALALQRAHAAGLELHAWMNCALVWSAPRPPQDPRHVLNRTRRAVHFRTGDPGERGRNAAGWVEGVCLADAAGGARLDRPRRRDRPCYLVASTSHPSPRTPDLDANARFALEHGADPAASNSRPPPGVPLSTRPDRLQRACAGIVRGCAIAREGRPGRS
jgi:hypothetical protein